MKIEITAGNRTLALQFETPTQADMRYISQFLKAAAPSTFDVVLTSHGESKINVIKTVREITSLGLKEAKELTESAPDAVVATGLSYAKADHVAGALRKVGAAVVLKERAA